MDPQIIFIIGFAFIFGLVIGSLFILSLGLRAERKYSWHPPGSIG
jgi:hypothetical protein